MLRGRSEEEEKCEDEEEHQSAAELCARPGSAHYYMLLSLGLGKHTNLAIDYSNTTNFPVEPSGPSRSYTNFPAELP